MSAASSSRHKLSIVAESSYGVTPDTPAFNLLRHTGTTIAQAKGTVKSETIDPTRGVIDMRHTLREVGGEIQFELNYGGFDTLLEALLFGTWATKFVPYVASTISAAAADNSINDSANAFPDYKPGDKFTLSGFTGTVGNNQSAIVVSRTASKIIVQTATALVNDAAGEAVTLTCNSEVLKNGVTRRSFSILRQYSDLAEAAKPFHLFKGCVFNNLSVTLSPEALVKGTASVVGREPTITGTAPTGATFAAAGTNDAFNAFVGALSVNGADFAVATEISLTVENGIEARPVLFSDKTISPKDGKFSLVGNLTAYFQDSTALDLFNNATEFAVFFRMTDPAGNAYSFDMPRCLLTGAQADVSGEADITLPLPFQALQDETAGYTVAVTRTPV